MGGSFTNWSAPSYATWMMGSLKFAGDERRCLGRCLVEAEYADCDRVPVSIVLNADRDQRLYGLDIWKAAFAPLGNFRLSSE